MREANADRRALSAAEALREICATIADGREVCASRGFAFSVHRIREAPNVLSEAATKFRRTNPAAARPSPKPPRAAFRSLLVSAFVGSEPSLRASCSAPPDRSTLKEGRRPQTPCARSARSHARRTILPDSPASGSSPVFGRVRPASVRQLQRRSQVRRDRLTYERMDLARARGCPRVVAPLDTQTSE